jgi:hypothetical protein
VVTVFHGNVALLCTILFQGSNILANMIRHTKLIKDTQEEFLYGTSAHYMFLAPIRIHRKMLNKEDRTSVWNSNLQSCFVLDLNCMLARLAGISRCAHILKRDLVMSIHLFIPCHPTSNMHHTNNILNLSQMTESK